MRRFSHPPGEVTIPDGAPRVVVVLMADEGSFGGDDGRSVRVTGYLVLDPNEDQLDHNNETFALPNLFFFRIAGMSHHPIGARSKLAVPMSELILIHEHDNPVDPKAIRVETMKRDLVGYVPAPLAPVMLPTMMRAELAGVPSTFLPAMMTKKFTAGSRPVSAEVVAAVAGVALEIREVVDN